MPKVQETSKLLRPYLFHGVNVHDNGDGKANGDCPFCGREGKFGVSKEGLWSCFVCKSGSDKGGGNVYTFLKLLWEMSDEATNGQTKTLAAERRLLHPDTLTRWGVCQSVLTRDWLVPGFNAEGKLVQLYRWVEDKVKPGRHKLLPTPELGHGVHGTCGGLVGNKQTVYVCEGPWDGLALWEVLKSAKPSDDGGLALTGAEGSSLAADAAVVAVPGCGSVGEPFKRLLPLFAGKRVVLCFDSDHPRVHQGRKYDGAGLEASKRAAQLLMGAEEPPAEICWIKWGVEGYEPGLPSGFDVRDQLSHQNNNMGGRLVQLEMLLKSVEPIPADWVKGRTKTAAKKGGTELELLKCEDWPTLQNAWRKAMKWTEGLDRALSVMLSAVLGTGSVGSQLWIKVMSPPSSGKSVLCEAISTNRRHVKALSTIRGFHSGYKEGDGSDNKSLILKIKNKTLVTKDGDTLLTAPNRDQIFAEARDLYDKTARSDYRTGMGMDHSGVNMTWILCGTSSLRQLDHSELGARFLDCVIMEGIDDDLENEINVRVAAKAKRNVANRANGDLTTHTDEDMLNAMLLTGGYIDKLHDSAEAMLATVDMSDADTAKVIDMAKFIAIVRARPSVKQVEVVNRELSARLVEQLVRLAMCLTVVLSKRSVDDEVVRIVRQTALDTARGRTMELCRRLHEGGREGHGVATLAMLTGESEGGCLTLLRFMRRIGAVEVHSPQVGPGVKGRPKWRLSAKLFDLYERVALNA